MGTGLGIGLEIGLIFNRGTTDPGSTMPSTAILTEDGLPILTEDGDFILTET